MGNLIRTFGGVGWEEEIPNILKKDMKSLMSGEDASSGAQPLNLQQRVIQSGLDSLSGSDAADIVTLFMSMAVFAEDQVCFHNVLIFISLIHSQRSSLWPFCQCCG